MRNTQCRTGMLNPRGVVPVLSGKIFCQKAYFGQAAKSRESAANWGAIDGIGNTGNLRITLVQDA